MLFQTLAQSVTTEPAPFDNSPSSANSMASIRNCCNAIFSVFFSIRNAIAKVKVLRLAVPFLRQRQSVL